MTGGYSMIDCTGFNFGNLQPITGIYDKLMTAYESDKPVWLYNCVNGSSHFTPIPAFLAVEVDGTTKTIILTIMNLPYRVSADDSIVQG